jgi:hypothetical protein
MLPIVGFGLTPSTEVSTKRARRGDGTTSSRRRT